MSDWLFSLPNWVVYSAPLAYIITVGLVCMFFDGASRKRTPRPPVKDDDGIRHTHGGGWKS
jgi:hypothetical protein